MFRLPGERRTLRILEGPYAGAECVVQDIGADPIRQTVAASAQAFFAADGWPAEAKALTQLYDLFVVEGQPTWALADHRGPIPPTRSGMWRLPVEVSMKFVDLWVTPPSTAVDEVIPPGPLRDALNRELRAEPEE